MHVTYENLLIFQDYLADEKSDQFSIINSIRKCGILLDIRQNSTYSCHGDPCGPFSGFQPSVLVEKCLCHPSPAAGMFYYRNEEFSELVFSCFIMGTF